MAHYGFPPVESYHTPKFGAAPGHGETPEPVRTELASSLADDLQQLLADAGVGRVEVRIWRGKCLRNNTGTYVVDTPALEVPTRPGAAALRRFFEAHPDITSVEVILERPWTFRREPSGPA